MNFKQGDEVVVCFPDVATDGRIEAIYPDKQEALVYMPFREKSAIVSLKILRLPPCGPYTLQDIKSK